MINFKTYSKSYKNKTRIENVPENILVFQDVHEPIIKRDVWELVQQRRGKIRKRLQKNCVGVFNPPDIFPTPDVQIQTRKGVVVSYSA